MKPHKIKKSRKFSQAYLFITGVIAFNLVSADELNTTAALNQPEENELMLEWDEPSHFDTDKVLDTNPTPKQPGANKLMLMVEELSRVDTNKELITNPTLSQPEENELKLKVDEPSHVDTDKALITNPTLSQPEVDESKLKVDEPSRVDTDKELKKSPALSQLEVDELMLKVDELSRYGADFEALIYLQQKHREKGDLLYKAVVYRQDEHDRLMMLFLKPKSDAGKGYLVLHENLFLYSPNTGDWTRVSEDRISGTDTNLADFDDWNLSKEYTAQFVALEKLGKHPVYHLKLKALPNIQVKAQEIDLWVDTKKHFTLKIEEHALSGRLLRTTYRTKWRKINDDNSNASFIPMETRIYDEVETGNQTIMVVDKITLSSLPGEMFSKAWLESKSR